MTEEFNIIRKIFQHDVVEGTHYEIGKQQAELIKKRTQNSVNWFTKKDNDPIKLGFNNFKDMKDKYEEVCPGIIEEFTGFTDGMGIKLREFSLFSPPIYVQSNCSQIAITSSITKDNHVYVGRSYEFHHDQDDLRIVTARIKGKTKTMGFSCFALGRLDGMNDHGFCITFTGGGTMKSKPKGSGFQFFLIVRSLLDNCKTVEDAVKYLEEVPIHGYWNFLMTDKSDNAALAQFYDRDFEIKRISEDSDEKTIFSGNHYRLPTMVKYQKYAGDWILKNSKKRCDIIESTLAATSPNVTKKDIRKLLSEPLYKGVSGYYYTDYFGTLFSVIFDLTDLEADICYGIPTHNDWQNKPYTLDEPVGMKNYQAIFPDKSIKTDELWSD